MRTSEIVQSVHSCAEGTIGCELRFGPIGRVHSRTIGMCVSDQHCVYTPQPVLREPFHSSALETLADINDDGPGGAASNEQQCGRHPVGRRTSSRHRSRELGGRQMCSAIRQRKARNDVQRIGRGQRTLMFFLPSGRSVEIQVRHCLASGGAVRQSTWGRLDEVPVPRKMSSTGSSV